MKLLIVDDEMYIRNSLKNGFDWASLGFNEVLDAARVSEALEIVDKNKIDVIITDIKMPKLSGIDLIKEMSSRSPETKIIIISGYDKFEYAQSALKYGVADYLLKPARIEDVVESVKKAVEMLYQNLPAKYKNVLIKDFLCNLIFKRIPHPEYVEKAVDEYDLDILSGEYVPAVFSYGKREGLDVELDDIINTVTSYMKNRAETIIFDDNRGHIVMILGNPGSKEDVSKLCEDCCEFVSRYFDFTDFECVIGRGSNKVAELASIYSEAVQIADRFVLSGNVRVIFASDIENVKIYNIVYMAKKYVCEHIEQNITIQMISDMIHITPGYFSSIFRKATGESFVKYVNMQKIEKAKKLLEIWDKPVAEIADEIGFDVKYFNRVFKKYTQLTPSEYRRMIMERK